MLKKLITSLIILGLTFGAMSAFSSSVKADTNLIPNPSVEISRTGTSNPANWAKGSWGSLNPTFTYQSTGQNGNHSLKVSINQYSSGDAKWYFSPVTIAPNRTYTYTDYYKSNVTSYIVAQITTTSNTYAYQDLTQLVPISTWSPMTVKFTTPSNAKQITIFHLIHAVGSLETDNFSLQSAQIPTPSPTPSTTPLPSPSPSISPSPTPNPSVSPSPTPTPTPTPSPTPTPTPTPPPTSTNIIPNNSLETVNGATPSQWLTGNWGTNQTVFSYLTDGHMGNHSVKIETTSYTDGDAKWYFTPQPIQAGGSYTFQDYYQSSITSQVVAAVTLTDGSTQYIYMKNANPASQWTGYTDFFTTPFNATTITIYHLIAGVGYLTTDDYSLTPTAVQGFNRPIVTLTFDDTWESQYTNGMPILNKYGMKSTYHVLTGSLNEFAYMTDSEVNAIKLNGDELAAHTMTHRDLTTLSASEVTAELSQPIAYMQQHYGVTPVNFATPYGSYNDSVVNKIKQYYRSHRSTDAGYNVKNNFNIYNIKVQNITAQTTLAEYNNWLTQAAQQKAWLVIVYHQVDTSGDTYSVTPKNLDAQLQAIKSKGLVVETTNQALNELTPQL